MSYYSDEDDDLDIHIRQHHRDDRSPGRLVYANQPRPAARAPAVPVYYSHGGPSYLVPERSGGMVRQPSSHRERSPAPVTVINNYNEYEDDGRDSRDGREYLQLVGPAHARSRSRSRVSTSSHDYELEKTRKELEAYKLEATREKEKERMKIEMEFKRLKEEKRRKEEEERAKKEAEEAVAKWQIEQEKKTAKEKKETEEREKYYKERMESEMRKGGVDENRIAVVLNKEGAKDPARPTYTRMSRRHLSIETLNVYRIDYEFDQDPDFLLIKRWVPEPEQDVLWRHTHEIRERRRAPQKVIMIEDNHSRNHRKSEPEFEFVRKRERRPSPSPLLTFFAGGKHR